MFYGHRDFIESDEIVVHFDPPAFSSSVLEPRWDDARQLIAVECSGRWTPAQVDSCFAKLDMLIGEMRSRQGNVRVLVDRRLAVQQPPETIERLKSLTQLSYRPEDRIAVVVDSCLSKQQLRTQLDPQTHKLFLSENAAMTWVAAHD